MTSECLGQDLIKTPTYSAFYSSGWKQHGEIVRRTLYISKRNINKVRVLHAMNFRTEITQHVPDAAAY